MQREGQAGVPWKVLVIDRQTKNARLVIPSPGGYSISPPVWLANGKEIVYLQNESVGSINLPSLAAQGINLPSGGIVRVVRQDVFSGAAKILLRIPHDYDGLDIMGSGRLVFGEVSARQSLQEISLQGKPVRWLTRGNSQDRQPAYSPDGEWVIFTSTRSGNKDLWEISTRTGAVRRLTDDPADDWDPAFTPDGTKILWSSNRSGHLEIWMAAADGSGSRQVTDDGSDAENPTMTRDGQWIVYGSGNPAKSGVWKIRADGSQATQLVAGVTVIPDISPDGQYAAYILGQSLRVVRVKDGAAMPFEVPIAFRPRWMPDGRSIAFMGTDDKRAMGVFVQDFVPGQDTSKSRRKLAGFDPDMPAESYGIPPDGSRVTVSFLEPLSSLMLADGVAGIVPPSRGK